MKACVLCMLVMCASASVAREERGVFTGGGIGISSGYGASYSTYGDYSGYVGRSAPHSWTRSPTPAYVYPPVLPHEVIDAPKVVDVPQVISTPQLTIQKAIAASRSPGYSGYGTGTTSGYYGYSGLFGNTGFSPMAYPRYSGYANGWI